MRLIEEIIFHASDTDSSWAYADRPLVEQVEEIRRWHVEERNFSDIGYHFAIGRNGQLMKGRPEDMVGAHCYGHNLSSLGVVLIGGRGSKRDDLFAQHFTEMQRDRAVSLALSLRERHTSICKVKGHNDYSDAKACPGFQITELFPEGI